MSDSRLAVHVHEQGIRHLSAPLMTASPYYRTPLVARRKLRSRQAGCQRPLLVRCRICGQAGQDGYTALGTAWHGETTWTVIALSRAACCGRLRRRGGRSYSTSSPTPLPTATPTAVPTAALEIAYIDHDSEGAWLMAADGRAGAGHASASGSQTGRSTAWRAGWDSNPRLREQKSGILPMDELPHPAYKAEGRPSAALALRAL
jgi:hypothetical protein